MRWSLLRVSSYLELDKSCHTHRFRQTKRLITLMDNYPVHINNTLSKGLVLRYDTFAQRGTRVIFILREERCPHIALKIRSFHKSLLLIQLDHQYSVLKFRNPPIIESFQPYRQLTILSLPTTETTIKMSQSPPTSPQSSSQNPM